MTETDSEDWYEWREVDYDDVDVRRRIAKEPEDDGDGLDWTEARAVEVEVDEVSEIFFVSGEYRDGGPYIDIDTEYLKREMLREEVQGALVNAVSLSLMPLVEWQEGDDD